MPSLSTSAEYSALREAIQAFSTGRTTATVTIDGMSVTYSANDKEWMQQRERELARRLTCRNVRKRTQPDFT